MTNTPDAAAQISVVSDSGQTSNVATAFASPLVVRITDRYGNGVGGVTVSFAAPGSGASACLRGSPAKTGPDGRAAVTAAAKTIGGSYAVTASIGLASATPVNFVLSNAYLFGAEFDQTQPYKSGSKIPIEIRVTDALGNNLGSSDLDLTEVSVSGPGGTGAPQGKFKFDKKTGTYQFSLKTSHGDLPGVYTFAFRIGNDPTLHSVRYVIA